MAKKCKICKGVFTPRFSTLQATCENPSCIISHKKNLDKKEWAKEKKEIIERNTSFTDWLKLLQIAFNNYIRQRDALLPCVSCGNTKNVKYDAGHFYGVQAFPNLRYDEDNCHRQCVYCNRSLYGNVHHYRNGILERIGQERFNALEARKNTELKISIPEIKEKIKYYKNEIKKIQQA